MGYGPDVKVAVAFDHRGVHLRDPVLEVLDGHSVVDLGTDTDAIRIDYPVKAQEIGASQVKEPLGSASDDRRRRLGGPRANDARDTLQRF